MWLEWCRPEKNSVSLIRRCGQGEGDVGIVGSFPHLAATAGDHHELPAAHGIGGGRGEAAGGIAAGSGRTRRARLRRVDLLERARAAAAESARWALAERALPGGGFRHDANDAAGPYLGDTLAMGRALMSQPKVLLLDEPSMGLSPIMVDKIFEVVRDVYALGVTIVLVEQNASRALAIADRGYVMESGLITMTGPGQELLSDPKVRAAYLGE